ncbi:MAG: hypothetical protein SGI89_09650 [bacterium]|nr:hypothetical protein [bacterium]
MKNIRVITTLLILISAFVFNACKDDSNPSAPPPANTANLIRLDSGYVLGAAAIASIYAEDSMHTGYNPVYFVLYDSVTLAVITDAHISFNPQNHGHSAPYENPPEIAVDGKFKGALVLTQSFTDAPMHWHINYSVHNHQAPGEPEGEGEYSPGRVRDNPDGFKSIVMPDSTKLYLSYITPNTPAAGMNDFEFIINKNEPEFFPHDGSYTIQMTPEFLADGHTTTGNVNPVGDMSNGHYKGKMNLDASGSWRIKLKVMKNTLSYDTYFDVSY